MLSLSNLSPQKGSTKQRKRLGRGPGSGHGKTSGRGHKGFKARSGSGVKRGFEGGQMPLQRRLPKRGFNNIFRKEFAIVNVKDLDKLEAGSKVDRKALVAIGLIRAKDNFVKILGEGELTKKFTVAVDKVSESARKKIESAGGTIEE
ncbi:MAG: 50S ribosomal protein L15 [Proteobacteria bacterium]|nr:50S ribosomal protein L15 [Pseudomonadota bacterium]MCG2746268.1 50S ribosomal protein L15 [Desulfobulbaceae bacterium]